MANASQTVTTRLQTAKNVLITNLALPLALTEYPLTLQANLKTLSIRNRDNGALQIAFVSGDSSLLYYTIPNGCTAYLQNLDFSGKLLYIQCNKPNVLVEVMEIY